MFMHYCHTYEVISALHTLAASARLQIERCTADHRCLHMKALIDELAARLPIVSRRLIWKGLRTQELRQFLRLVCSDSLH